VWFFGGESGVNLDTITSSAVPVHGLQTRRAGRWNTIADACAMPGGVAQMASNIWSGRSIRQSYMAYMAYARRLRANTYQ